MLFSMTNANTITVHVERTDYGKVRARSEGYQPMHIVCDDFAELHTGIGEALTGALKANGRPARVIPPDCPADHPEQVWLACPD